MAVKIIDSKLKLLVGDDDAKPDIFLNPGNVIFHLTRGFNASSFPLDQGNALTAGAHVPLGGDPGGTSFGFVQIARSNFFGVFYAGRIAREGSIGLQVHIPPALPSPVMLDASGNPPIPFFQDPSRSSFIAPSINSTWGDHPASKIPLKLNNSIAGNIDNFLFNYIDDREFWTIFTAKDPDGTLRYIANFHWQVRYDAVFAWRNGAATVRLTKSFFRMHERNEKGPPSEPAIQALLTSPVDPRANVAFGNAIRLSFFGPRGPNRSENRGWFANVPRDFWT